MIRCAVMVGVAFVLALASCDGDGGNSTSQSACVDVDQVVIDVIQPKGNVGQAQAVKTTVTRGPADVLKDTYYVAIDVDGEPAVWAIGRSAFETRSAIIIAADDAARRVSNTGDLFNPADFALGPGDPDYADAKDCIK